MSHPRDRRTSPASGVAVAGRSAPRYDAPSRYPDEPRLDFQTSGRTGNVYGRPPVAQRDERPDRAGIELEADLFGPPARRRPPATTAGRGGDSRGGGNRPPTNGGGNRSGRPAGNRPKRRDPLWARLLVVFGAVLMVSSGGAIVAAKALVAQVTNGVDKAPLLGEAGIEQAKGLEGPLNILMVGVDERPAQDRDPTELVRADSIIIVHISASHDQAYLISLPRDALVDIPAFPKTKFTGSREKINGAFAHGWANGGGREGGFQLLALTIQRFTGLRFNAGAIVDFQGFEKIVDSLGGIDLCVDSKTPVKSEHWGFDKKGKYLHPHKGGNPMVYYPGECRKFKGWEALDYVRQRKSLEDGDYGRARHQQQFVKALAKEAKKQGLQGNPVRFFDIVKSAGKALTVDLHGASFESWAFTLRNVTDSDMVLLKANGGKFNSVPCGGESCEGLSDETLQMFQAMKDDNVAEFVVNNPTFVST